LLPSASFEVFVNTKVSAAFLANEKSAVGGVFLEFEITEDFRREHEKSLQNESEPELHFDRTSRCYCNHRNSGWHAAARTEQRKRTGTRKVMYEQYQTGGVFRTALCT
jgi:hypothetical protein